MLLFGQVVSLAAVFSLDSKQIHPNPHLHKFLACGSQKVLGDGVLIADLSTNPEEGEAGHIH